MVCASLWALLLLESIDIEVVLFDCVLKVVIWSEVQCAALLVLLTNTDF